MFDGKHVFNNVTFKLTLKMTLNHQNNIRNVFSSQNHIQMTYYNCPYLSLLNNIFSPFAPQIGLLTLKMTLNHQNNTRIELFSQNYTETRCYNLLYMYLLKNHVFTHSTLTFDLENDFDYQKCIL